jgi:NADP-dependent 3-hydroxy acid dehydrogenase YdfG
MRQDYHNQIIWIIGASSGIGAALAAELAGRGATLALSARRTEALNALTESLNGEHSSFVLDVTNREHVESTAQAIYARYGRIDRIIFLAAAYTPMTLDRLDIHQTKQMIDINIMGALHVVHAVLPLLKQQNQGQIVLCGSVAGYTGLAGGQPYSATKAAIMNLAESMHTELSPLIDVKLISPGFVKSELTDKNNFAMPMMISAEQAARHIADGLTRAAFEVHFPKRFTFWLKLVRLLPYSLAFWITKKLKA